jgi:hypothetical protein
LATSFVTINSKMVYLTTMVQIDQNTNTYLRRVTCGKIGVYSRCVDWDTAEVTTPWNVQGRVGFRAEGAVPPEADAADVEACKAKERPGTWYYDQCSLAK